MGGSFGRRQPTQFDPFAPPLDDPFYDDIPPGRYGMPPPGRYGMPPGRYGIPPPYPYSRGFPPTGGYDDYDPYDVYGYDYEPSDPFETYGPMRRGPFRSGRFGRGPGSMSPYNYGNFYMGNTTMQMMPLMQRKLAKFQQRQGMGMGGMGSMGCCCMPMMPCLPSPCSCSMPCLPSPCSCSMPCLPAPCSTPCCSSPCSMPMGASMMAAAMPLPGACSPLIQGMYPSSSPCCNNFMSPSSFMSALSTGPMAYRPPPSFQFPSNVGMVMPFPNGASNPLLSPPSFGGFSPQSTFGGGFSCSCSFCTSSGAPPAISYYPNSMSVPQSYPVPQHVSSFAPPVVPSGAPLHPFQGGFTQGGVGQPLVMTPKKSSTTESFSTDKLSVSKSFDSSRRAKAQQLAASLSKLGLNEHLHTKTTSTKLKNRSSLSISNDKSDWLTSDNLSSLLTKSKHKRYRKSTRHSRSHRHTHDCVVCKEKRIDKFS